MLDLLMRLEGEARKAGGRVHALLGNHEVMNMLGDLRYVNAEEYKAWQEPESTRRQEHFYENSLERARKNAKAAGQSFDEDAFRRQFLRQAPLGFVERTTALSAEGRYGKWLRERPVVAKVNGVVFVHGGLTPDVAALGCPAINAQVRRELNQDVSQTQKVPIRRPSPPARRAPCGTGASPRTTSRSSRRRSRRCCAPSRPGRSWSGTR